MVLDIELFRQEKGNDPQLVRDSQKKRYKRVEVVDEVIALDTEWRTARWQADQWNKMKNLCGKTVGAKKQAKENEGESEDLPKDFNISLEKLNAEVIGQLTIKQLKRLSTLIDLETEKTKEKVIKIENDRNKILHEIGNIVHHSVPVSNDEVRRNNFHLIFNDRIFQDNNVTERTFGDVETRKKYSHFDLMYMIDGYDGERGAQVAGSRGYFMKVKLKSFRIDDVRHVFLRQGPAVFLEQAIIQLALNILSDKDFEILYTPFFMRKEVMQEVAQLSQFDEELYKVVCKNDKPEESSDEEKYLIATSEQAIAAFHR